MANARPSNLERRKLRDQCREVLSKHIKSKLGIEVHPSQVHLMPKASDPYRWKIIPGKEKTLSPLFSKNISDHSIGAYRELCEGVDKTFEAVLSTLPITSPQDSIVSLQCPEISFSTRIEQLEQENARLFHELCQWRDKVAAETKGRQLAEEEASQLYETNQQLQDRIQNYSDTANYLTGRLRNCFQGLGKVVPILSELKSEIIMEDFPIMR